MEILLMVNVSDLMESVSGEEEVNCFSLSFTVICLVTLNYEFIFSPHKTLMHYVDYVS